MATGLVVMTNDSEISTRNLMYNFYYLEKYLKALAIDNNLIQGVALNTDFQSAVVDGLSQDTTTFIANLATEIYNKPDFVEEIVTSQQGIGGATFDGLAYNAAFIEALTIELVDSTSFINAFLAYFEQNAGDLYKALKSDVFQAYYGPNIADVDFATNEENNPDDGDRYSLWTTGEPPVTGDQATDYIGFVFGLEDELDDAKLNIFVSKNVLFPIAIANPGPTDSMRFTKKGTAPAGDPVSAVGFISGAFFEDTIGYLLLDISALEWDGEEELYIRITGVKAEISMIRVGFDFAKHAAQVNDPSGTGGGGGGAGGYANVVVNSQTDWEKIAGGDGTPELAEGYYNIGTGRIEWPAGFKVILQPIDTVDYGKAGQGYVFDWNRAYAMYNPIWVDDNIEVEAQGKVSIVKQHADATFRSEPRFEVVNLVGNSGTTDKKLQMSYDLQEGEIKEGDLIYYSHEDQFYYVIEVDHVGNEVTVDRDLLVTHSNTGTLKVLHRNIKMHGFYFDGRGAILENQLGFPSGIKAITNGGGAFANFEALGNSVFDINLLNCKATNGGAVYLDTCYNLKFFKPIKYCKADGGNGGAIYGGFNITAEANMCQSTVNGGGFAGMKFSILKVYKCRASTDEFKYWYDCPFSELIHYDNFNTLKTVSRTKINTSSGQDGVVTNLHTVGAGVSLVIADFFIVVTADSGVTAGASLSIGNNASDYDNLFPVASLYLLTKAAKEVYQPARVFGKMAMFEGGDVIKCKVGQGSDGTQEVEIVLLGYEYQEL